MKKNEPTDQLKLAAQLVGYASARRYQVRGESLFGGIPLSNKQVLEIGSGTGAWAIWAGLHGAKYVVGIEPEGSGSTANSLKKFKENIEILGLAKIVTGIPVDLEQFLFRCEKHFDVIVMFDVINHLDENAVTVLHRSPLAMERYVNLFRNLSKYLQPGGWCIVADCGRRNFWNSLGITSPITPTIEWHKHQDPPVWIEVFRRAGFQEINVQWSPLQPIPQLTSNRLVQYLTKSHFIIRCRVPTH